MRLNSYAGWCEVTWINKNQVLNRFDGGTTVFFKLLEKVWYWPFPIKHGEEMHGIILNGSRYVSTSNKVID